MQCTIHRWSVSENVALDVRLICGTLVLSGFHKLGIITYLTCCWLKRKAARVTPDSGSAGIVHAAAATRALGPAVAL